MAILLSPSDFPAAGEAARGLFFFFSGVCGTVVDGRGDLASTFGEALAWEALVLLLCGSALNCRRKSEAASLGPLFWRGGEVAACFALAFNDSPKGDAGR